MWYGVYILNRAGELLDSMELRQPSLNGDLMDSLRRLIDSCPTSDLEGQVKHREFPTHAVYCIVDSNHIVFLVADKTDDKEDTIEKTKMFADALRRSSKVSATSTHSRYESICDLQGARAKVIVIGFPGVGKTTLVSLLKGGTPSSDTATGREDLIKNLPVESDDVNIVLWEIGRQSGFSNLWGKMISGAQVGVVVTDSTLENVLQSKKLVNLLKEEASKAKIIGIANKQDLPGALPPERVEALLEIPTYGFVGI
ncbi:MAG: hypothetical protein GF309_11635 [Candidatus Lokiarchaeota archaeon]|nr:hypothetical protein [Candidatus Lokiarchaeota archaeon]